MSIWWFWKEQHAPQPFCIFCHNLTHVAPLCFQKETYATFNHVNTARKMAVRPVQEVFCTVGVTRKTRRKGWTVYMCVVGRNENLKKQTAATRVSVNGWYGSRFCTIPSGILGHTGFTFGAVQSPPPPTSLYWSAIHYTVKLKLPLYMLWKHRSGGIALHILFNNASGMVFDKCNIIKKIKVWNFKNGWWINACAIELGCLM